MRDHALLWSYRSYNPLQLLAKVITFELASSLVRDK